MTRLGRSRSWRTGVSAQPGRWNTRLPPRSMAIGRTRSRFAPPCRCGQSVTTKRLNAIEGIKVVAPTAAFYVDAARDAAAGQDRRGLCPRTAARDRGLLRLRLGVRHEARGRFLPHRLPRLARRAVEHLRRHRRVHAGRFCATPDVRGQTGVRPGSDPSKHPATRARILWSMPSTTSPPASSAPPSGSSSTADRAREWFHTYTRDLSREDLERLFTHDTRDAYDFFARGLDEEELAHAAVVAARGAAVPPGLRRLHAQAAGGAPGGLRRRARHRAPRPHPALSRVRVVDVPVGIPIFQVSMPLPVWANGTFTLVLSLILVNLLMLLEVAERLSLKGELEVAREIQLALLPRGHLHGGRHRHLRLHETRQHRRRRLLRRAAAVRRTHHADARRRRGQRQSGGAAHGAAPRRAAHARRRAHRTGGARRPAEHPDLPPQPGVALHHARLRDLRTRPPAGSRT